MPSSLLLHSGQSSPWEAAGWVLVMMVSVLVASLLVGRQPGRGTRRRIILLLASTLALAIAISPPFDEAADRLFVVHMAQHMALIFVVAPLLALSQPELIVVAYLRDAARRRQVVMVTRKAGWLSSPVFAASLMVATLWVWHVPRFFDAALANAAAHAAEHASFVAAACLFWRCLTVDRRIHHLPQPVAMLMVFTTMIASNVLGGLLALSSTAWFSGYARSGSLDPLTDQHLAGVVMWVTGTPFFIATFLWLAYTWLRDDRASAAKLDRLVIGRLHDESIS